MMKSTSETPKESLVESGDDESTANDLEVEVWEKARRASIADFYTEAKTIPDISTSSIEMRRNDDQCFVDLLVRNEYLFKTVRDFFENARQHEFIQDACLGALLEMVEQALHRRSELCYLYNLEVWRPGKNYSVDVIREVEEEIHVFMLTLRPFVLNDVDVEKDSRLITSVFNSISTVYRKVSESRESVLKKLEMDQGNDSATGGENQKETLKYLTEIPPPTTPTKRQSSFEIPPPTTPTKRQSSEESSEESISQQGESQGSFVTTSTYFDSPNKK